MTRPPSGPTPFGSANVRALIALALLYSHWFLSTRGMSPDTSITHHPFAGPYVLIHHLRLYPGPSPLLDWAFALGLLTVVWGSFVVWIVRGGWPWFFAGFLTLASAVAWTMFCAAAASAG
jgi:hypothetical protein